MGQAYDLMSFPNTTLFLTNSSIACRPSYSLRKSPFLPGTLGVTAYETDIAQFTLQLNIFGDSSTARRNRNISRQVVSQFILLFNELYCSVFKIRRHVDNTSSH